MNYLKICALIPIFGFVLLKALDSVRLSVLPNLYVFDAANLQRVVKDSLNALEIDASAQQIMESVHSALKAEYPAYIVDYMDPKDWVFSNHGSAMGSMLILHASLTEYLIFYGTPLGSDGHSGTHLADDYFTIFYGEEQAAYPNATTPERYPPGEQHHLPYGMNKQYRMLPGTYALELAQGYIPTMLPFGMIEVATSTLDLQGFGQTCWITAKHMFGNLLQGKI